MAEENKEKIDEHDKLEQEALDEKLKSIQSESNFGAKLEPYNKPVCNVILGLFFAFLSGCVFPTFGVMMMKV
jgi:hypothetical protein